MDRLEDLVNIEKSVLECPYCKDTSFTDPAIQCPECQSWQHLECIENNGYKCAACHNELETFAKAALPPQVEEGFKKANFSDTPTRPFVPYYASSFPHAYGNYKKTSKPSGGPFADLFAYHSGYDLRPPKPKPRPSYTYYGGGFSQGENTFVQGNNSFAQGGSVVIGYANKVKDFSERLEESVAKIESKVEELSAEPIQSDQAINQYLKSKLQEEMLQALSNPVKTEPPPMIGVTGICFSPPPIERIKEQRPEAKPEPPKPIPLKLELPKAKVKQRSARLAAILPEAKTIKQKATPKYLESETVKHDDFISLLYIALAVTAGLLGIGGLIFLL